MLRAQYRARMSGLFDSNRLCLWGPPLALNFENCARAGQGASIVFWLDQRKGHIIVLRLGFIILIAISAISSFSTPSVARDAQTVINVMLSEIGASRPSGCPGRWCACYLDTVLARTGLAPRGSNLARDFANYGEAANPGAPGSIMVMSNHVGVVVGDCGNGQVKIVSGNYSNTVALGCYSPNRAIAWRAPVRH